MAKNYDYAHDPERRYGCCHYYDDWSGLIFLALAIGAIWVLKTYWFVAVPCIILAVVIPVLIHFVFHEREKTLTVAIFGLIVAVGYFVIWFFIAHPGFLEVILGLKPY